MKALLIGNFGAGNYGDEMILIAFLERFLNEFPTATVGIVTANEDLSRGFLGEFFNEKDLSRVSFVRPLPFGVRSLLRHVRSGSSLRKSYAEFDLAIYCGGGLFTDEESPLSVPMWASYGLLYKRWKRPVYAFGLGCGPIRRGLSRQIMTHLVPYFSYCGVRDEASLECAQGFGGGEKVHLTRDSVFLLDGEKLRSKVDHLTPPVSGEYIAVTMRPWKTMTDAVCKKIAHTFERIIAQTGLRLFLVPFQEFPQNDKQILNKISAHILKNEHIFVSDWQPSLMSLLGVLSHAKMALGMRLHSGYLSAVLGASFVIIPYADKGRGAASFGDSSCIPLNRFLKLGQQPNDLTNFLKSVEDAHELQVRKAADFNHIATVEFGKLASAISRRMHIRE